MTHQTSLEYCYFQLKKLVDKIAAEYFIAEDKAAGIAELSTSISEIEFSNNPESDWHTIEQRLKGYGFQEDIIENAKQRIKARLQNGNG